MSDDETDIKQAIRDAEYRVCERIWDVLWDIRRDRVRDFGPSGLALLDELRSRLNDELAYTEEDFS